MFSGIIGRGRGMVSAIAVLTAAAILPGGTAAADPSQDDKFFALLGEKDIPALDNATSLIDTAHKICSKLDGGMSVDDLVDLIRNNGYNANWRSRLDPPDRVTRTINRFITAAVQAYCPYDERKIASIAAYPATRSSDPAYRVTAYTHKAVNSERDRRKSPSPLPMVDAPAASQETTGSDAVQLPLLMDGNVFVARRDRGDRSDWDAHGLVLASLIGTVPSGEIPPSNPLPIPAKPPPAPQEVQPAPQQPPPPPRRVHPVPQQAPPQQAEPPQQAAPPPQAEPPPPAEPPQQAAPPAAPPQPGGGPGGDSGGAPASPPPEPPKRPGFVQLAP